MKEIKYSNIPYCPLCGLQPLRVMTNIESHTRNFVHKCNRCNKLFVISIYEEDDQT